MRTILFSVFLTVVAPVWGLDPWKAQAGGGLWWPEGPGGPVQPYLEVGWFTRALDPGSPEFFDLGARATWSPDRWSVAVGARHKLYGLATPLGEQEVLVGWADRAGEGRWTLGGRFGVQIPWEGPPTPRPLVSSDLGVVWALDWMPGTAVESRWGLDWCLGLGGGAP